MSPTIIGALLSFVAACLIIPITNHYREKKKERKKLKADLIVQVRNFFALKTEAIAFFNLAAAKKHAYDFVRDGNRILKTRTGSIPEDLKKNEIEMETDITESNNKLIDLYRLQEKSKADLHAVLSQCSGLFPDKAFLPINTSIRYHIEFPLKKITLPPLVDDGVTMFKEEFKSQENELSELIKQSHSECSKILAEIDKHL